MNIWKAFGRITAAVGIWTICAGILFFVLAERGQTFAAILIAVSGFAASPITRGTSSGSSGQSMRKKVAIGSAALSCIMVLAFSDGPAPVEDEAMAATSVETEVAVDDMAPTDNSYGGTVADAAPQNVSQVSGCSATDGDTLNCAGERIRLLGIDSPEMPGHCAYGRDCVIGDPYAAQASLQSAVQFQYGLTIERVGTDRYGRTLGMVYVGNQSLSCHQLAAGQAIYRGDWDDGGRVSNECVGPQ